MPTSTPENLNKLSDTALAKLVPAAVVKDWDDYIAKYCDEFLKADPQSQDNKAISEKILANYGRWIVGLTPGKESKVRYVQTDVPFTAPQRLAHIKKLEEQLAELKERIKPGLGQGYGYDMKRMTAAKTELTQARNDLLADADGVFTDMKKELFALTGGKRLAEFAPPSKQLSDESKFKELLSFSSPGGPATFETSVPSLVKEIWAKYLATALEVYPLKISKGYPLDVDEKKKVTNMSEFWQQSLADWYAKGGLKQPKDAYDAAVKDGKKEEIEKSKAALLGELDKQFATYKTSISNMLPPDL